MKVYAVLCESKGYYNPVAKISQQGYKTLEEAQAFCRSRADWGKEMEEENPYVFKGSGHTYTITEINI